MRCEIHVLGTWYHAGKWSQRAVYLGAIKPHGDGEPGYGHVHPPPQADPLHCSTEGFQNPFQVRTPASTGRFQGSSSRSLELKLASQTKP